MNSCPEVFEGDGDDWQEVWPAARREEAQVTEQIDTLQSLSSTEEADINFMITMWRDHDPGHNRDLVQSFRKQIILAVVAIPSVETTAVKTMDGRVRLDVYAGKTRAELKTRCGQLCRALDEWQHAAMSAATDSGNVLQNVREPYRTEIARLIEAYSDDNDHDI